MNEIILFLFAYFVMILYLCAKIKETEARL